MVHVFVCSGRFRSLEELHDFALVRYDDDGNALPSLFIEEVTLTDYEPMCIEAVISEAGAVPVKQLLAGASYSQQWLSQLANDKTADAAICIFAPNRVETPERSSLEYLGAFEYRA